MKGIEISERYFTEVCLPMIRRGFPELEGRIAFGIAGEGSECFGYDDEISRDHDFEPSLCLWLGSEDYKKYGFSLSRAYSKLPQRFMGLERQKLSPVGGARRGVIETGSFYKKFLGTPEAPRTWEHWLSIPEYALACASNGKVFKDELGEFSKIRNTLKAGYPRDVLLKKLSSRLVLMAQSGQYNYERCLAHKDKAASRLALFHFVKNALSAVYLLNNRYEPFYKWAFRGLSELEVMSGAGESLAALISDCGKAPDVPSKVKIINEICSGVCREIHALGMLKDYIPDLEGAAYMLNENITDPELRNLHILAGAPRE